MKRVIIALAAVMAMCSMTGSAETIDFSKMGLSELYRLRDQLNAQIGMLEQAGEQQVYDSGSYRVGTDIPAGDYVLTENENAMFASVIVRESDAEDSNLLAHHLINHQLVVRLQPDTWLTLSEAKAYPISQAPKIEDGVTGEGGYLVGVQIPAGVYAVCLTEKAPLSSYSIYDDIIGTNAQLIKFEVVHEAMTIELHDGEYVELSGCHLGPMDQTDANGGE